MPENCENLTNSNSPPLPPPLSPASMNLDRVVPNRFNEYISVNEQGGQLLDFCISSKFSISNGRIGDFRGKFTYVAYNGCSNIDLVLASENIINEIKLVQYLQI